MPPNGNGTSGPTSVRRVDESIRESRSAAPAGFLASLSFYAFSAFRRAAQYFVIRSLTAFLAASDHFRRRRSRRGRTDDCPSVLEDAGTA